VPSQLQCVHQSTDGPTNTTTLVIIDNHRNHCHNHLNDNNDDSDICDVDSDGHNPNSAAVSVCMRCDRSTRPSSPDGY
jgi:hypothetical protein